MIRLIIDYLNIFFMYYIFIYAMIYFVSTIYSMLELNEQKRKKRYLNDLKIKNNDNDTPISILVPAYNEEDTIIDCINSLLDLDYSEYEIIVIDDGSVDNTRDVVMKKFKLNRIIRPIRRVVKCKDEKSIYEKKLKNNIKLTLVTKENGGKADALNMGINLSKYPLFVTIDADSILQRDSLKNIATPFMEDDTTIAVGGNIKVANAVVLNKGSVVKRLNNINPLVIFQIIEYCRVFLTSRIWFNSFNGNLIISGAFGLFKKNSVINVGGYNTNTVGEDMDLVVKLHSFYRKNRLNYKIKYSYNAICWSQVPERIKDLKSQRRRWHVGLITSLLTHKYIFLNPKYGLVGLVSYLYYLVYEMLSCVTDVLGVGIVIISYFTGLLNRDFLFTFLLVYIVYSVIISVIAIVLNCYIFKEKISIVEIATLILFAVIESFGYRQLCSWYRISSFIGYRKSKHQWGHIKRKRQNKEHDNVYENIFEDEDINSLTEHERATNSK